MITMLCNGKFELQGVNKREARSKLPKKGGIWYLQ